MLLYSVFKRLETGKTEMVYSSLSRNKCSNFIMDNMISFDPDEFYIVETPLDDAELKDIEFKDDTAEYNYNLLFPFSVKYDSYFNRLEINFGEKLYKTKLAPGSRRLKFPLTWRMFEKYRNIPGYDVVSKDAFDNIFEISEIEAMTEISVRKYVLSEFMKAAADTMITDMNHTYRNHITISTDC